MFSFWSNGEDENSENSGESDEERDKRMAVFCYSPSLFLFDPSLFF